MAAPAAPAVPAAAALAISFVALTASILLWAMRDGYEATLGALFSEIADLIDGIPLGIGGKIAGAVDAVNTRILESIEWAALEMDKTASKFWAATVWLVELMVDAILDLAKDTEAAVQGLAQGALPGKIADLRGELRRSIDGLSGRQSAQARAEAIARTRGIDALRNDVAAEARARQGAIDALAAQVGARVDGIADTLRGELADVWGYTRRTLARRLSRVEQLVLGGAITVAAVRMLDRRFPYWKCTNVRRVNKAICRAPVGWLDDVLKAGVAILVLSDICTMARLIREGAEAFLPVIRKLVVVTGAALQCSQLGSPKPLTLAAVAVPTPSNPLEL